MHAAGSIKETENPVTLTTLGALFQAVHARHPQRIALSFEGNSMTYAEFDAAAGRVAAGLVAQGVTPGALVAICLERNFSMVVAMLGVIKAGAAYLPLDPRYPLQRLRETVADASPAVVIVEPESALPGLRMQQLQADQLEGPWVTDVPASPADLAYVIYTSGSTGKPKGVEVTHANVAALLASTASLFAFTPQDVWTMFHSFAFDFSVWEIWGCLLTGGRLVIVPFAVSRAPETFRRLLVDQRVTVLNQTPSAFALLDREDAAHPAGELALRLILFGGEALAGVALRDWFGRHGDTHPQLVNMYGITETTVHVTHRTMRIADADERESLMGQPIPGWTIELIDAEICVGGAGVARGYLGRPQLTAERFVNGLYHSGDLARRRPDGELVYLGRRDGQVKLNGFRIETGEVEAALLGCAGVQQACVVVREGRLVAYLVGTASPAAELKARLPSHMLPSAYVPLPALPLNPNGKIDRNALPPPVARAAAPPLQGSQSPQGSPMEQLVARAWATVLGSPSSPNENFFDVGGTSILLIAVRAALQEQLARPIPITWMFECTTIRTLAHRLEAGEPTAPQAPGTNQTNADRQRQAFARARQTRGAAR